MGQNGKKAEKSTFSFSSYLSVFLYENPSDLFTCSSATRHKRIGSQRIFTILLSNQNLSAFLGDKRSFSHIPRLHAEPVTENVYKQLR